MSDEDYQAMLRIILKGREEALAHPRVDMPGADIFPGLTRQMIPMPLPAELPVLYAKAESDAVVELKWKRSANTIGLAFDIHRSNRPDFTPEKETLLAETDGFQHLDRTAPAGVQQYALVMRSGGETGSPMRASVRVLDGEPLAGRLAGNAGMDSGVLDLRDGGHAVFPNHPDFDLRPRFSVSCLVKLSRSDKRPVLLSYGRWREAGWFLQKHGNAWRWHAGGATCDGGKAVAGEWKHLAAVFDGRRLRLFQDGEEVRSVAALVNRSTWAQELMIGQYSGGVSDDYQLHGEIADVQIFHRALKPEEVRNLFETAAGESLESSAEPTEWPH